MRWRARIRSCRALSRPRHRSRSASSASLGGLHLGQQPCAQQLGQLTRIPPVGLDPLPGLDRDQRGRDHLTHHPLSLEFALQRVAQRPGPIARPHLSRGLAVQPSRQPPDGALLVGFLPAQGLLAPRDQHRDLNRPTVCVQPHPGDTLRAHDRLLSYAALVPLALTRDRACRSVRHRRLLSREARPYDREPVVPYGLRRDSASRLARRTVGRGGAHEGAAPRVLRPPRVHGSYAIRRSRFPARAPRPPRCAPRRPETLVPSWPSASYGGRARRPGSCVGLQPRSRFVCSSVR
jgi:hypothetical protein